jgi:hypothetical protein
MGTETGADGGTAPTTGAEVTDSLTGGGAAVFPQCCLKRKAAPNTSNASSNIAKMNFGLMILFQAAPTQKKPGPATPSWLFFSRLDHSTQ